MLIPHTLWHWKTLRLAIIPTVSSLVVIMPTSWSLATPRWSWYQSVTTHRAAPTIVITTTFGAISDHKTALGFQWMMLYLRLFTGVLTQNIALNRLTWHSRYLASYTHKIVDGDPQLGSTCHPQPSDDVEFVLSEYDFLAIDFGQTVRISQVNITTSLADSNYRKLLVLAHWDRVTLICVNKQRHLCSDNGLSPVHYLNQSWLLIN